MILKYIPETNRRYAASDCGHIFSLYCSLGPRKFPRIVKATPDKKGYSTYYISNGHQRKRELGHRLIARTFLVDFKDGMHVHHKDGDKANNHITNLEMIDPANHARLSNESRRNQHTEFKIPKITTEWVEEFMRENSIPIPEMVISWSDAK